MIYFHFGDCFKLKYLCDQLVRYIAMNVTHGRTRGVRIHSTTPLYPGTSHHWWHATDVASRWSVMQKLVSFPTLFCCSRLKVRSLCDIIFHYCSLWGCSKVRFVDFFRRWGMECQKTYTGSAKILFDWLEMRNELAILIRKVSEMIWKIQLWIFN